ncbi:hypothetical protein PVT68_06175 [Microbulbifer bruguierae]|uniref:DUF3592 domain-containing protein n=1 Tax=Microbulbifer bruguierae TaxID=3029061 RepID=A0ABY8NG20_9GAMM|nr:DUF3592 domain-containing protein [Microbulbifer bruguierae]WGL17880.1 hypothetical protein PVT68_06175 [Microbulbifer bruguierae]
MHSIVFMLAGLLCVALALIGKKTRQAFIAESFLVRGKVVDIKEERQKSGDSTNTFHFPIIEYKTRSTFRFKAEVDADQHLLNVGDSAAVMVSKKNHKIAKLKNGTKELYLLLNALMVLGISGCVLSIYLFDPKEFNLDFIKDPFTLLFTVAVIGFLTSKMYPPLKLYFNNGPRYSENAYEVSNIKTSLENLE